MSGYILHYLSLFMLALWVACDHLIFLSIMGLGTVSYLCGLSGEGFWHWLNVLIIKIHGWWGREGYKKIINWWWGGGRGGYFLNLVGRVSQYQQSPSFLLEVTTEILNLWNFQSEILKRGISEKNECLGRIKEFLPCIFTWKAYYVSCLKRPLKIKYGLEGSISNVDLGLF